MKLTVWIALEKFDVLRFWVQFWGLGGIGALDFEPLSSIYGLHIHITTCYFARDSRCVAILRHQSSHRFTFLLLVQQWSRNKWGVLFPRGGSRKSKEFCQGSGLFFKDKHTRAAQMVRRTQHIASLLTATRKQKKTNGESILFSLCPFSSVQKWKICAFFFFISLPLPQLGLMKLSGPFRRMVHGAIGFCEKQFSFSIPWWPVYAITLFIVHRRNSSVQQCADCLKLV